MPHANEGNLHKLYKNLKYAFATYIRTVMITND